MWIKTAACVYLICRFLGTTSGLLNHPYLKQVPYVILITNTQVRKLEKWPDLQPWVLGEVTDVIRGSILENY